MKIAKLRIAAPCLAGCLLAASALSAGSSPNDPPSQQNQPPPRRQLPERAKPEPTKRSAPVVVSTDPDGPKPDEEDGPETIVVGPRVRSRPQVIDDLPDQDDTEMSDHFIDESEPDWEDEDFDDLDSQEYGAFEDSDEVAEVWPEDHAEDSFSDEPWMDGNEPPGGFDPEMDRLYDELEEDSWYQ